ncbi:MAG: hypothetical protein MK102_04570 [Fuerstiella sp.]|nr:hypothetical protein [Fuerstiella sp.]
MQRLLARRGIAGQGMENNGNAKPSNLVVYEYALETLRLAFDTLASSPVEKLRAVVAQTIIAVA